MCIAKNVSLLYLSFQDSIKTILRKFELAQDGL